MRRIGMVPCFAGCEVEVLTRAHRHVVDGRAGHGRPIITDGPRAVVLFPRAPQNFGVSRCNRRMIDCSATDRAMNTFRRGMLALREYRAPYRRANITAIKQLNQAEQQNIMLAEKPNSTTENATNEQGANCGDGEADSG